MFGSKRKKWSIHPILNERSHQFVQFLGIIVSDFEHRIIIGIICFSDLMHLVCSFRYVRFQTKKLVGKTGLEYIKKVGSLVFSFCKLGFERRHARF